MESTLKNMVLTLLIITFIAAAAVGAVYQLTKGPIAIAKGGKTIEALSKVLPTFDNNPATETQIVQIDGTDVMVYTAKSGSDICGYAIEATSSKGFGGAMKIMVGFKPDGEIIKIEALQHNETPGLGDKIEESKSDFPKQFAGKNPATFNMQVKKDGGQVDAITASTISSRAYVDAIEIAYKALQQIDKEVKNE